MDKLIGLTGGIGSGKSVVSRLLRLIGYEVYDCDSEAAKLMENDSEIKCRIRDEISPGVTDGKIPPDRKKLASIVFADEEKRLLLNAIVHGAVRVDIHRRRLIGGRKDSVLFVESAILAESALAERCDEIWLISTDELTRIRRVSLRDGLTGKDISDRIKAQRKESDMLNAYQKKIKIIMNDNHHSLTEQVGSMLKSFSSQSL